MLACEELVVVLGSEVVMVVVLGCAAVVVVVLGFEVVEIIAGCEVVVDVAVCPLVDAAGAAVRGLDMSQVVVSGLKTLPGTHG